LLRGEAWGDGQGGEKDGPQKQAKPETTPTPCALHKVVRSAGLDLMPGTRRSVGQDYTHPARRAQFEIFMVSIDFSDAESREGAAQRDEKLWRRIFI